MQLSSVQAFTDTVKHTTKKMPNELAGQLRYFIVRATGVRDLAMKSGHAVACVNIGKRSPFPAAEAFDRDWGAFLEKLWDNYHTFQTQSATISTRYVQLFSQPSRNLTHAVTEVCTKPLQRISELYCQRFKIPTTELEKIKAQIKIPPSKTTESIDSMQQARELYLLVKDYNQKRMESDWWNENFNVICTHVQSILLEGDPTRAFKHSRNSTVTWGKDSRAGIIKM